MMESPAARHCPEGPAGKAVAAPGHLAAADFIDFGCGGGQSMEFAAGLVPGRGVGIDLADEAVRACRARGLAAERGNLLQFGQRSVALATFAIDVMQELPGRIAFERGLTNIVQAARNFALIQHPCFDADPRLALSGRRIDQNFGRKIQYKPTAADYIAFAESHGDALNLSGIGIFGNGRARIRPMTIGGAEPGCGPAEAPGDGTDGDETLHRSLRVIIGRKDVLRFRSALRAAGSRNTLFIWERP